MNRLKSVKDSIDWFSLLRLAVATLLGIGISIIIIFSVSKTPGDAIKYLFLGPFESKRHFFNILESCIPLIFTGVSLSLVFKSGNFSMITDAALYMGGTVAAVLAVKAVMPAGVHPVVILLVSSVAGAIIGGIPGILKVRFKANELVTSLMLNYVFFYIGIYIVNKCIIDREAGTFASLKYARTARLITFVKGTNLHVGIFIALAVTLLIYLLIYKTKFGYEIRVVGSNLEFAKYTGIKAGFVIVAAQMVSGAVAGLGGAVEQLGMYTRFNWQDSPSYAWDGVILAILSGNNPKYVPVAAVFLAYIRVGADVMSRNTDVQNELVSIIQAVIILFITAERFLNLIRQRKESKKALENDKQPGGD